MFYRFLPSQVMTALHSLFWGLLAAPSLVLGNSDDPLGDERYAALECQHKGVFAVVNFYPNHVFRLSWGVDDLLLGADIAVQRTFVGGMEAYQGKTLELRLPTYYDDDNDLTRIGRLELKIPVSETYDGLVCVLYGVD